MFYLQWLLAQQQAEREQYRQMLEFINYPATSHTPPPVPTCTSEFLLPYPSDPLSSEEVPVYTPPVAPDQIPRQSTSPPLVLGDRPKVSRKRRKPQSALPSRPLPTTIHSEPLFTIDEEKSSQQLRPPPIQINGICYAPTTNEGYLTPPLTSKSFSLPSAPQGPFGGYTSPIIVPSDIV